MYSTLTYSVLTFQVEKKKKKIHTAAQKAGCSSIPPALSTGGDANRCRRSFPFLYGVTETDLCHKRSLINASVDAISIQSTER